MAPDDGVPQGAHRGAPHHSPLRQERGRAYLKGPMVFPRIADRGGDMDHSATVKPSVAASAERIQDLMANVSPALAMLAGMQLGVFTGLGDGVRDASDLASGLAVAEEPLSRLLYALVVCGLLERRGGGFANSSEAANFL